MMRLATDSNDGTLQEIELSACGSIEVSLITGSPTNFNDCRRYSLSDLSSHDSAKSKKDSYRFISMSILTSTMMAAEIVTGVFTGSLTLLSDALHMISDLIALLVGFAAHRMANTNNKLNSQHTIVVMRYEIVGALINGTMLLTSCFIMILEAIKRLVFFHESVENVDYVLIVGGLGLFINIIGLCIFGHHGHSHSHSHNHNHNKKHDEKRDHDAKHETNLNMRAVFLHIFGDLLGSIAVMVSAVIIKFTDGWWNNYIDPFCTLLIIMLISLSALPLIKESANILLDKSPFNMNINNQIKYELTQINGVLNVHELHCWQIKTGYYIASVHLIIEPNWLCDECRNKCDVLNDKMTIIDKCKVILHKYKIHSSIVQSEFPKKGNTDWKKSKDPCFDYICNESDCIKKSKALAYLK